MKNQTFDVYIKEQGLENESMIRNILLDNAFLIIGNSNSHNYYEFAEPDGVIWFNNPSLGVDLRQGRIMAGCTAPGITGNNILFKDIMLLVTAIPKKEIVEHIEYINRQQRDLEEDLKKQNKYLEYLVAVNKDGLVISEFEKWYKEQIGTSLVPTK